MNSGEALITGTQEEKRLVQDGHLITQPWMKHYTHEQWIDMGSEARKEFVQREMLVEMVVDMSDCLYRHVDTRHYRKPF